MPKPSRNRLGPARPTAAVWSANMPAAQVAEERRRLAVEVGDEQVGPAVAVEVADGRPHARLERARGVAGDAASTSRAPRTSCRRGCARGSWPSCRWRRTGRPARRRRRPPRRPRALARRGRRARPRRSRPRTGRRRCGTDGRDERGTSWACSSRTAGPGSTGFARLRPWCGAERRMVGVPDQVMADVQVEVAVAVQVGEGGRSRPVAVAAQPGAFGDVLERCRRPGCGRGRTIAIG